MKHKFGIQCHIKLKPCLIRLHARVYVHLCANVHAPVSVCVSYTVNHWGEKEDPRLTATVGQDRRGGRREEKRERESGESLNENIAKIETEGKQRGEEETQIEDAAMQRLGVEKTLLILRIKLEINANKHYCNQWC